MSGITNPAEAYFKDGVWGWNGSAWKKLALLFGFTDTYAETIFSTTLAAGTNILNGTAVASSYIHVVTNLYMIYYGTVPTTIQTLAYINGSAYPLFKQNSPESGVSYTMMANIMLATGDYMRFTIVGATLNDDAYLYCVGYKMAVS